MAENNALTVENASTTSYQFEVTVGSANYTQQVAGGASWNVPATIPCDQSFTVAVSGSGVSQSFSVLNAVKVIYDDDGLGCLPGACSGGCTVTPSS